MPQNDFLLVQAPKNFQTDPQPSTEAVFAIHILQHSSMQLETYGGQKVYSIWGLGFTFGFKGLVFRASRLRDMQR